MDKQKDFEKCWEEYKKKRKQEQEELIGIIQGAVGGCATHWASLIAEEVLKYYQPKIPENAVVLTPAERDEEMSLIRQNVIERMEETRKETAEKFAEMAKARATAREVRFYQGKKYVVYHIVDESFDIICKEITGVEDNGET